MIALNIHMLALHIHLQVRVPPRLVVAVHQQPRVLSQRQPPEDPRRRQRALARHVLCATSADHPGQLPPPARRVRVRARGKFRKRFAIT
eukprot:5998325-Pyramimonas_sp.AAC.1